MILNESNPGSYAGGPYNLSNANGLMANAGVRFAPHQIIVQNLGSTTVRLGASGAVSASAGHVLAPGEKFGARLPFGDEVYLYGTTSAATDINITVVVG